MNEKMNNWMHIIESSEISMRQQQLDSVLINFRVLYTYNTTVVTLYNAWSHVWLILLLESRDWNEDVVTRSEYTNR